MKGLICRAGLQNGAPLSPLPLMTSSPPSSLSAALTRSPVLSLWHSWLPLFKTMNKVNEHKYKFQRVCVIMYIEFVKWITHQKGVKWINVQHSLYIHSKAKVGVGVKLFFKNYFNVRSDGKKKYFSPKSHKMSLLLTDCWITTVASSWRHPMTCQQETWLQKAATGKVIGTTTSSLLQLSRQVWTGSVHSHSGRFPVLNNTTTTMISYPKKTVCWSLAGYWLTR